jgi:nitric oxide reductase large subunit
VPSKSAARAFFLLGIIGFAAVFLLLTINTIRCVPAQTKQQHLTEQVVHGKHLWEHNNCMGYHTLFGEGAYYAPELTKTSGTSILQTNSARWLPYQWSCISSRLVGPMKKQNPQSVSTFAAKGYSHIVVAVAQGCVTFHRKFRGGCESR